MAQKPKTKKEKEEEQQIKHLRAAFERRGIAVRREKLSRGYSFRVKSGDCLLSGQNHVFVDRRLPLEQQVSLLVDYIVDYKFELEPEEVGELSKTTKNLLSSKVAVPVNA